MRNGRRKCRAKRVPERPPRRRKHVAAPIPLAPVDLLAGLAPGVELGADALPPGLDPEWPAGTPVAARVTVGEVGKLLRSGDRTLRGLIRRPGLGPAPAGQAGRAEGRDVEVCRAGVLPRTRRRPGE
jgi:hypothetical protein